MVGRFNEPRQPEPSITTSSASVGRDAKLLIGKCPTGDLIAKQNSNPDSVFYRNIV